MVKKQKNVDNKAKGTIELSKQEYTAFIKLLFFAEYCNFGGFVSYLSSNEKDNIYKAIQSIYKISDTRSIPKDNHIRTSIPLVDEEFFKYKEHIESDLENMAWVILAKKFAKRDLKGRLFDEDKFTLHTETYAEINARWIYEGSKKYLKEFKNNDIENLRFKMFYTLPENDDEE